MIRGYESTFDGDPFGRFSYAPTISIIRAKILNMRPYLTGELFYSRKP